MDIERDELVGIVVPVLVYWAYSGLYMWVGDSKSWDKYRLNPREDENVKNLVTKKQVVKGVLIQQAIQVFFAFALLSVTKNDIRANKNRTHSPLVILLQVLVAAVVLDSWQYFMHRYMHENKFLYKHIHSKHHELIVPYAIGALYNHPLEGLLMDTVGSGIAFLLSGMTPTVGLLFFSFATIKTVDDHCGLIFPGNPLQTFFKNNSAYHSIHHQLYGLKYNYSQPFFVVWDKVFGTYMDYALVGRKGGGIEARPMKVKG